MHMTRVSVIIPYTRAELIKAVLAKLLQQTYPLDLVEIIVVGPQSSALADIWCVQTVDTSTRLYPGAARNLGAHVATGEYLLFLDDDCEPASDWVEQNVRELQRVEIGAVGGQITGKSNAFFARCVDFSSFAFCQVNKRQEIQLCSASLGIRREVYMQVHGFDETLRTCEDIDFCYRLMKLGYKTIYQPAIKVLHNHQRRSFPVLMRYSYFFGRASGLSIKLLHPGMTRRNQILIALRSPFLYALMILPISFGITMIIIKTTFWEYPYVLLYSPFIFLSKLAFHTGVLLWIIKEFDAYRAFHAIPQGKSIHV
ncbi:MAG: hypothetical protein PVS3B3_27860 [Ktedonobacteraceae bacterium]